MTKQTSIKQSRGDLERGKKEKKFLFKWRKT